jgi:phage shock protein PspC (stress-responsive transcriptional regulator)
MKKIININLSGRVIPIEDSAYEKLQAYIESLRRYFAHEDGRDEIINDIESRIAELMNENIRKGAAAITDADVEEIAKSMGRPEDFEAEEKEDATESGKQTSADRDYSYAEKKAHKRLYRNSSDKFIAGVCSGIANYMNVDPAIVRILFAIVALGGFGMGLFIYILLWIILPDKDLEGYAGKRLYRNPEDRVIGGVAGGLAAYFNTKTSTIRLIFAAPFLLSIFLSILNGLTWHTDFGNFFPNIIFGSLGSTLILAYIILWIVLPEARSTYEKMEMRGEKVDVNTIRQNMKDRMKEWGEEVKESAQNFSAKAKEFSDTKGKRMVNEISQTARNAGTGIGHAIGVIFKVFFLFIAGSIAFGLFVALMALIFGGIAFWPVNNFLWTSKWQQIFAWGTIIFFFLVPLVGFFIWLIRRITGIRSRRSYLGWTFGFLWTLGWVSIVMFGVSVSKDFRVYNEETATDVILEKPAADKMVVMVTQPELEYNGNFNWINDGEAWGWDMSEDTLRLSTIRFEIPQKSYDSLYHVIIRKSSFGRTRDEAQERAERIQYHFSSKENILDLGSGYTVDRQSKFRGQQVEVEVYIPAGKKISFDRSVTEKLNPSDFRRSRRYSHKTTINGRTVKEYFYDSDDFRFQTGVDYTMGDDGKLRDPAGRIIDRYNYNWYDPSDNSDSARVKRELEREKQKKEQKEREIEESERKIKELEKKSQDIKSSTAPAESINSKSIGYTSSPSPVFSLMNSYF